MTSRPALVPPDAWLDALSTGDLEAWLEVRLAGHDPHFPFRPDDQPGGELIARRCAATAPKDPHTLRLAAAVEQVAARLVQQDEPDPDLFHEALGLLADLAACRLPPALRHAAGKQRFKSTHWQQHGLDRRLLLAITAKPATVPEGFWKFLLTEPRFMELALVGLQAAFGWERAADHVPGCLPVFAAAPEQTHLPLALLHMKRAAPSPRALVDRLREALGGPHEHAALLEEGLAAIGLGGMLQVAGVERFSQGELEERLERALRTLGVELPNGVPQVARASLARGRDPDSLAAARALEAAA